VTSIEDDALERLVEPVAGAVAEAGRRVLLYQEAALDPGTRNKADDSPVTRADLEAHAILDAALRRMVPRLPLISEEGRMAAAPVRAAWPACWMIDPLDGTREFLAGSGEYTVNVALVRGGRPVLGVVGVPARARIYYGSVPAGRAWATDADGGASARIATRGFDPARPPVVLGSRSHRTPALEAVMARLRMRWPGLEEHAVGSALKFLTLAEGGGDLYPRRGPCSEWDTAGPEAVLAAAGGCVRDFRGRPLRYNKADGMLNPDFWAAGDPDFPWLDVLRAGRA